MCQKFWYSCKIYHLQPIFFTYTCNPLSLEFQFWWYDLVPLLYLHSKKYPTSKHPITKPSVHSWIRIRHNFRKNNLIWFRLGNQSVGTPRITEWMARENTEPKSQKNVRLNGKLTWANQRRVLALVLSIDVKLNDIVFDVNLTTWCDTWLHFWASNEVEV